MPGHQDLQALSREVFFCTHQQAHGELFFVHFFASYLLNQGAVFQPGEINYDTVHSHYTGMFSMH